MEPLISMSVKDRRRTFRPGETLESEYQIDAVDRGEVQAVEASVLWYTEGKGEEDMAVHFFERRVLDNASSRDLRELHGFETELPNSPLSYDGEIVSVRWCVRVRAYLKGGKEICRDQSFVLGEMPHGEEAG